MLATSIAMSGIQAGLARFDASAANVANVGSTDASGAPYQPVRVQQSEAAGGGVTYSYQRTRSSEPLAASPDQPAAPSVDLVNEAIEQMIAKQSVKANVAVLHTACDMQNFTIERFA